MAEWLNPRSGTDVKSGGLQCIATRFCPFFHLGDLDERLFIKFGNDKDGNDSYYTGILNQGHKRYQHVDLVHLYETTKI